MHVAQQPRKVDAPRLPASEGLRQNLVKPRLPRKLVESTGCHFSVAIEMSPAPPLLRSTTILQQCCTGELLCSFRPPAPPRVCGGGGRAVGRSVKWSPLLAQLLRATRSPTLANVVARDILLLAVNTILR